MMITSARRRGLLFPGTNLVNDISTAMPPKCYICFAIHHLFAYLPLSRLVPSYIDPFRVVMGSPFDKSDKFLLQFFLPAGSLKVVNAPEVVHNVTGLPKIHLFGAKKKE